MQTRRRKRKPLNIRLLFYFTFILGLSLILFPIVSQWMYYQAAKVEVSNYTEAVKQLDDKEKERRIELAKAYNSTLNPEYLTLKDPFSKLQKEGLAEYARMLEVKEQMGVIRIPKILVEIPIYAGTSENVLQRGAGHLEGTSLPIGGVDTHTVITAHRGLPNARLFTDLDKIKTGDVFYIENLNETLAYQVDKIKVVEPSDIQSVKIVEGKDRATLLTCTPYMINSHRLLVQGKRIPYTQEIAEKTIQASLNTSKYRLLFYGISIILLICLIIYWKFFRK